MNTSNEKKSIVLVSLSHLEKPRRVLGSLINSTWVSENFNIYAITNHDSGSFVDLLNYSSIPYRIVDDVRQITSDLEQITEEVDYLLSCGWGWRISEETISLANEAAINCHSSKLPDYRGPSVYRAQWAHAEKKGGATIHYLNSDFDDGNIICQSEFSIGLFDSPDEISNRVAETTACLIREALLLLEEDYEGTSNAGGRYFTGDTVTSRWLYAYRAINLTLRTAGSNRRVELPSE